MSSHDLTLAVYLLLVGAGVALEVHSRHEGARVPSLTAVLRQVMRTRPGRVGVIAAWAWIGLHFLSR